MQSSAVTLQPHAPPASRAAAAASSSSAAPKPNPFVKLANVEIALVQHFLDSLTMLALSRTSKHLRRASESKHAWSHSVLWLRPNARVSSSLLAHGSSLFVSRRLLIAPLGIRVDDEMLNSGLKDFCAFLERIPSLHTLEMTPGATLLARTWKRIAAAPCTLQLRVVRLDRYSFVDADLLRMLCSQLTHLHTLYLPDRLFGTDSEPLLRVTQLTSLRIPDSTVSSPIPVVLQMDKLQRLTIHYPTFFFLGNFKAVWSSACFAQLVHLGLEHGRLDGPEPASAEDLANWLRSMLSLQSLELVEFESIDSLLPHLPLAPRLLGCTIKPGPSYHGWKDAARSRSPSIELLVETLHAAPRLSVSIVMLPQFRGQTISAEQAQLIRELERISDPAIRSRIDAPTTHDSNSSPELSPRDG